MIWVTFGGMAYPLSYLIQSLAVGFAEKSANLSDCYWESKTLIVPPTSDVVRAFYCMTDSCGFVAFRVMEQSSSCLIFYKAEIFLV